MNNYLNAIKTFCYNLEKSGKITPINFTYPSFSLNENGFRKSVMEYVTERVRIGLLTGDYGNKKINDNINYESLLSAEQKISKNMDSQDELGHRLYLEKMLPTALSRDEYLEPKEINKSAVKDACVNTMQYALLEINDLKLHSVAFERDNQSTYVVQKAKFAASMIMLSEQIPSAYKAINQALDTAMCKDLVLELRGMEFDPSLDVIQHIKNLDSKMALEKFPKEVKLLNELSQEIKFNL